ncbi:MAG: hypothetical protein IIA44_15565 [Acidobacteria bacterium]|nr:hypothetical protein [Acidobacteriota bacterium]
MARSKRIFISDFHLNSQQRYQAGDAWFDPNIHQVRLINFLNNEVIAKAKLIKDLILLGDIFDNWVCPVGDVPPTYDAIGKDNAAIIDVLDQVQKKGIGLYYINGNHDFDLTAEQVRAIIPGIRPVRSYLGAGRSHAEHGGNTDGQIRGSAGSAFLTSAHNPVGWSANSQGMPNLSSMWVASALTPKVSVA